jgi:predicted TPR repeat methyltransferase
MRIYIKITIYCLLFTVYCLLLTAYCLVPTAYCQEPELSLTPTPTPTPEPEPESLQLPEVVITGIDRSKFQRIVPKEEISRESLPAITESSYDLADFLVHEGDVLGIGQVRRAEDRYAKAIELDPTNSTAYLRLGDVYQALNKYVDAAEAYQKALDVSAENREAHYKLGILYESRLQDTQKAIEHYQKYLQLGGSDQRVRIWLRNAERQTGEKPETEKI